MSNLPTAIPKITTLASLSYVDINSPSYYEDLFVSAISKYIEDKTITVTCLYINYLLANISIKEETISFYKEHLESMHWANVSKHQSLSLQFIINNIDNLWTELLPYNVYLSQEVNDYVRMFL